MKTKLEMKRLEMEMVTKMMDDPQKLSVLKEIYRPLSANSEGIR